MTTLWCNGHRKKYFRFFPNLSPNSFSAFRSKRNVFFEGFELFSESSRFNEDYLFDFANEFVQPQINKLSPHSLSFLLFFRFLFFSFSFPFPFSLFLLCSSNLFLFLYFPFFPCFLFCYPVIIDSFSFFSIYVILFLYSFRSIGLSFLVCFINLVLYPFCFLSVSPSFILCLCSSSLKRGRERNQDVIASFQLKNENVVI